MRFGSGKNKKQALVTVGLELRQVLHSAVCLSVCGDSPTMLPPKELLTLIL